MQGIKPFKLSFLTRPFQHRRATYLGVAVLAYFPLGRERRLLTDIEMWTELPAVLGADVALDTGIPKSRAEFLVAGAAHQVGGEPGPTRTVRVQVGDMEKSLWVIGDRRWEDEVPTPPEPFASMPLDWAHAFGGEGYAPNPTGKGFSEAYVEGMPLPNVELPGELVDSPGDTPAPAGFGALDFMAPERARHRGTYGAEWLENDYLGFAADMDWRIWNLAPPDQQREAPFVGDEELVFEHLHPTRPKLEAKLPGVRARCFVMQRRSEGADATFHEVPLKLTTLWLLPGIERGVMVFHGAQPTREDDGADVDLLMVAGELLESSRPVEHYRAVVEKRTKGEDRALEILNEEDLLPKELVGFSPEMDQQLAATTPDGLRRKRQRARSDERIEEARARLVELGLDPDEHGPAPLPPEPKMPSLGELIPLFQKAREQEAELKAKVAGKREETQASLREVYATMGLDPEPVLEEMATGRRGPPTFDADAERARFRALAFQAAGRGQPVDELEWWATDEEVYRGWRDAQMRLIMVYRIGAHLQPPAFALEEEAAATRRAEVEAARARGEDLEGWDLTGADLSGMDLNGVSLERALMESANLRGARLDGANLRQAVLAHADLTGASLSGACLVEANIGKARLTDADLSGADLEEATVTGAVWEGANLAGARLKELYLEDVVLDRATLTGADLSEATIIRGSLDGVSFREARLHDALFMSCDLRGLDFALANLDSLTLYDCRASGARFEDAFAKSLCAVMGTDLSGAVFTRANLSEAYLRTTPLRGADLRGATLTEADFSEADLEGARLEGASARESAWIRANLARVDARGADLLGAHLEKAKLFGADLSRTNLYGANMALIRSDADTTVEGAIRDRVRARPFYEARELPDEGAP